MLFDMTKIDSGSTAWLLVSAALVIFMTPGLAFFYARASFGPSTRWACWYRTSSVSASSGYRGHCDLLDRLRRRKFPLGRSALCSPGAHEPGGAGLPRQPRAGHPADRVRGLPADVRGIHQPALITGATADHWKFGSFCAFVTLWSVVVYAHLTHWVFSPTGWLFKLGAEDFAGGTVVHINAGAAALAVASVLGRRFGFGTEASMSAAATFRTSCSARPSYGSGGSASTPRAPPWPPVTCTLSRLVNTNTATAAAHAGMDAGGEVA